MSTETDVDVYLFHVNTTLDYMAWIGSELSMRLLDGLVSKENDIKYHPLLSGQTAYVLSTEKVRLLLKLIMSFHEANTILREAYHSLDKLDKGFWQVVLQKKQIKMLFPKMSPIQSIMRDALKP